MIEWPTWVRIGVPPAPRRSRAPTSSRSGCAGWWRRAPSRGSRPRPWRWWSNRRSARPSRRPRRRGRRRRRRRGRRRRRPRAPGPAGRPGSRPGSGRPGGSGRCRRARGTAPRARTGGRRTRPGRPGRPCRWRCRRRPSAGPSAATSTNERTWSAKSARASRVDRWPGSPRCAGTPAATMALMRSSPVSAPDRLGLRQAELDAVVLGRVVAGGEHRPGRLVAARGEVHEVGGAEAEVDHVEPLGLGALGEGGGELDPDWGACRVRRGCGSRPRCRRRSGRRRRRSPDSVSTSIWSGTVPRTS